jgi:WD40 repeat protein
VRTSGVKCWDLETDQVIRHYHGHLSGIFALSLHPTLDILVTGGRDAVARVWDIRGKNQIHVLTGHDHTIASILTKSTDPQDYHGVARYHHQNVGLGSWKMLHHSHSSHEIRACVDTTIV